MNEITVITKWLSDKDGNKPIFPFKADWEDITGTPCSNLPCNYVIIRARLNDAELAKVAADATVKVLTKRVYCDEQAGDKPEDVIDYEDKETQLTKPQLDAVKALTKVSTLAANRTREEYLKTLVDIGCKLPKITVAEETGKEVK